MGHIELLESGYVDRADSAFPTLVALDTGEIVCGFNRGGGPYATGGTHCARSADGRGPTGASSWPAKPIR